VRACCSDANDGAESDDAAEKDDAVEKAVPVHGE
jgi:hypothetical protein